MLRPLLSLLLLTVFAAAPGFADTPIPTAPTVDARAYIVVDYHTGKVLASKEAVARLEPASLTKLMTAYLVFTELSTGKLKLEEPVVVSEHAWRSEGSRTFIELSKPVRQCGGAGRVHSDLHKKKGGPPKVHPNFTATGMRRPK